MASDDKQLSEYRREQAVLAVLSILRHPLALMSIPDREKAYALAHRFDITARDLLDAARERSKNA